MPWRPPRGGQFNENIVACDTARVPVRVTRRRESEGMPFCLFLSLAPFTEQKSCFQVTMVTIYLHTYSVLGSNLSTLQTLTH